MKAFVTGGTGFIGRHLVRRMSRTKHEMVCLVRETSDSKELEELGAQLVIGDVTDRDSLRDGMNGCDWLLNLANVYSYWEREKYRYKSVNIEGTRNALECALEAGISKVVHVSTVVVYGKPKESPFSEESAVGPLRFSEYARSKYEGDLIAWDLYKERGLPLVMIYPGAVLGSGDASISGASIDRFIHHKLPATVFNKSVMTYVHVQDVAEAILKAAEMSNNIGEKYIVGNTKLTFDEFYNMLGELSGVSRPLMNMPDSLALFNASILTFLANVTKRPPLWGMSTDAMRALKEGCNADGSKAEQELGFSYSPIRDALKDEVEWYRDPSHSHYSK
ncbi:MAG TPA: NAD-dependent epimerase/dehydratase family protein [Deltaproteobacteria bacterium]|nr:NAD-dependent epimerase/dehydratase family protein [Deltaproteobacteria bacterium]